MARKKKLTVRERTALEKRYPGWQFGDTGDTATVTLRFAKQGDAVVFLLRLSVRLAVMRYYPSITMTERELVVSVNGGLTAAAYEVMDTIEKLSGNGG